jgi:hypothetical protein
VVPKLEDSKAKLEETAVNNLPLIEEKNEKKDEKKDYGLKKSKPKMSSSILSGIQMISKTPYSP